jgi:hypothetical protein
MEDNPSSSQKRSAQSPNNDWVDLLLNAISTLTISNQSFFPLILKSQHHEDYKMILTESSIIQKTNLYLSSINPKVKINYQNALVNAIMDIGGKQCFPHYKSLQLVPMEIVYPLSGGRGLWHVRDPRCKIVCETLRKIVDFVRKQPEQLPVDRDYVNGIRASSSFEDINNTFIDFISRNIGGIPKDIPT